MGSGFKSQIAQKLIEKIGNVTIANGYSQDVKTVAFDKVKVNISDYADFELPAVQLIDQSKKYNHEFSRSKSEWRIALELCMRTTSTLGVVDQQTLWDLEEDIVRAIMEVPNLGLNFLQHVTLTDEITDLHLQEPNYIAIIGLEILYYEPITRDNC